MHMDEPIARDVSAADSTRSRTDAVLGRRVPSSFKSSSCCDIFMTRTFPGKKSVLSAERAVSLFFSISFAFNDHDFLYRDI